MIQEPLGSAGAAPPIGDSEPTCVRVAALTGGRDVPSARFRVRQLIGALRMHGIETTELVARVSRYPPRLKLLRPFWGVAAVGSRIAAVAATYGYHMTLLQRELLSTLTTLEPMTRGPRVLDVDDAIFVHRRGRTARQIAERCVAVVCGNSYLADHFNQWNSRVSIVPTGIDTERFTPGSGVSRERITIGWIGTSGNGRYLEAVEPALVQALDALPRARLLVVSDRPPTLKRLRPEQVSFRRWSEEEEVGHIQDMTIGIMPLVDSAWARGKCSFKMLQYMSCGVPVVVSPVGMNRDVLRLGAVGLAASSLAEWTSSLVELAHDEAACRAMGRAGRGVVESHFALNVVAKSLSRVLREAAVTGSS